MLSQCDSGYKGTHLVPFIAQAPHCSRTACFVCCPRIPYSSTTPTFGLPCIFNFVQLNNFESFIHCPPLTLLTEPYITRLKTLTTRNHAFVPSQPLRRQQPIFERIQSPSRTRKLTARFSSLQSIRHPSAVLDLALEHTIPAEVSDISRRRYANDIRIWKTQRAGHS